MGRADRPDLLDHAVHGASAGQDRESGVDRAVRIGVEERGGRGGGEEHLAEDAGAAMVELRVPAGVFGGQLGVPGADQAPDLAADGAALRFEEEPVVPGAGERRADAALDVVQKHAVLGEIVPAAILPEFDEVVGSQPRASLLERFEPDELDVHVVVGDDRLGPELLAGERQPGLLVFHPGADGPPDALAQPARAYPVAVFAVVEGGRRAPDRFGPVRTDARLRPVALREHPRNRSAPVSRKIAHS